MIVIYGLRLKGDKEVRYIGQSANVAQRLAGHLGTAHSMPWATDFAYWLIENADTVEAVELTTVETREEARRVERNTVGMFVALGHRLFNQWLVPAQHRCAPRTRPYIARWRRVA